jgi:hypothetical protein
MVDEINVNLLNYTTFFNEGKFNRNKVKESWIKSHYPIDYLNIITFCLNKNFEVNNFSQKLYHYILNIDKIPICCKCERKNQRYLGFNLGYDKFCSKSCASSNSFKKGYQKRIENTIKKYGVNHTTKLDSVRNKMKSTNLKRYGVKYSLYSAKTTEQVKNTNMKCRTMHSKSRQ